MITWAGIGVAFAAWLFGLAVVGLVERVAGAGDRPRLERHALALLLGLALLPALCVAAIAIAGPPTEQAVRLGLLVCAGLGVPFAAVVLRRRAESAAAPSEPPRSSLGRALAGAGLVLLGFWTAFAAFTAWSMPMHVFDPLYHFAYKGSLLYHEGFGTSSWMIVPEDADEAQRGAWERVGRPITHPNYPPGLPALHVVVGKTLGRFDIDATRGLMFLFAWVPAALLWTRLRRRSRSAALLGSLTWLSLPMLYYTKTPVGFVEWGQTEASYLAGWRFVPLELVRAMLALFTGRGRQPDGWTMDGAADLPLAAFLLGAFVCLVPDRERRRSVADACLGGGLLGGAMLYKNEGLALSALLLAMVGAVSLLLPGIGVLRSRLRHVLLLGLALAVALLFTAPWLAIRGDIPSIDEDYPRAILSLLGVGTPPEGAGTTNNVPTDLGGAFARLPVVLGGFGTMVVQVLRWNLLWFLVLLAPLAFLLRRPTRALHHAGLAPLCCVLGAFALYTLVLMVTPWDLAMLFNTLIPDRLMLHVAPLALLAALEFTFPTRAELGPAAAEADA